jgi:hypothetical protein
MHRLCKCGHRKYKHNPYPLDWPYCKGANEPKFSWKACLCCWYVPMSNLEYLESLVNNNILDNKV